MPDFAGILTALSICTSYFLNPLIAFIINQLGSTFVIAICVVFVITWTTRGACTEFGKEHVNSKLDMFLNNMWLMFCFWLIKVIGV